MHIDVLMPNLNINVALEGEPAQYVEIPLVPAYVCPELAFPPTFIAIGISFLLFPYMPSCTYFADILLLV